MEIEQIAPKQTQNTPPKVVRKVHIVPSVPLKDLPLELQQKPAFMREYTKLINDTKKHIKFTNGSSKHKSHHEPLYYLHDNTQMKALFATLAPESEIVIHGESVPFIMGFNISSIYDLTAAKLARLLLSYDVPEGITITLQGCNTATPYKAKNTNGTVFNFARDLSKELLALQKKDIQVKGYTGALEVKDNGKMGTCYDSNGLGNEGKTEKVRNCSAEDATAIYQNGRKIQSGKTLTKGIVYKFLTNYVSTISNNKVINRDVQSILSRSENLIHRVSSGEIPPLPNRKGKDNAEEPKKKKKTKKPPRLRSAFEKPSSITNPDKDLTVRKTRSHGDVPSPLSDKLQGKEGPNVKPPYLTEILSGKPSSTENALTESPKLKNPGASHLPPK